jgi:hypothetical protein
MEKRLVLVANPVVLVKIVNTANIVLKMAAVAVYVNKI